jgi:hypothetical protein
LTAVASASLDAPEAAQLALREFVRALARADADAEFERMMRRDDHDQTRSDLRQI